MPKSRSDAELLEHIHDLADGDDPPTATELLISSGPAMDTYQRRFGSWSAALEEAGYEPRT